MEVHNLIRVDDIPEFTEVFSKLEKFGEEINTAYTTARYCTDLLTTVINDDESKAAKNLSGYLHEGRVVGFNLQTSCSEMQGEIEDVMQNFFHTQNIEVIDRFLEKEAENLETLKRKTYEFETYTANCLSKLCLRSATESKDFANALHSKLVQLNQIFYQTYRGYTDIRRSSNYLGPVVNSTRRVFALLLSRSYEVSSLRGKESKLVVESIKKNFEEEVVLPN